MYLKSATPYTFYSENNLGVDGLMLPGRSGRRTVKVREGQTFIFDDLPGTTNELRRIPVVSTRITITNNRLRPPNNRIIV